jgi:hypothetical protein
MLYQVTDKLYHIMLYQVTDKLYHIMLYQVTDKLYHIMLYQVQHRRQLAKLIMMYRITYHLIEIPSITYLIPSRSGTRGHNIRYLQPSTRVLAYQYSFFPSTIRLWNNLPQTLVSSGSIDIFRHSLTNTSLP